MRCTPNVVRVSRHRAHKLRSGPYNYPEQCTVPGRYGIRTGCLQSFPPFGVSQTPPGRCSLGPPREEQEKPEPADNLNILVSAGSRRSAVFLNVSSRCQKCSRASYSRAYHNLLLWPLSCCFDEPLTAAFTESTSSPHPARLYEAGEPPAFQSPR